SQLASYGVYCSAWPDAWPTAVTGAGAARAAGAGVEAAAAGVAAGAAGARREAAARRQALRLLAGQLATPVRFTAGPFADLTLANFINVRSTLPTNTSLS
ncbi:hypothetical protein JYU34_022781, partial [Plutella xylostella]